MAGFEHSLWILAIILLFGLIIPEFFKKLRLPFATSLILVGAVLGPSGLNYVEPDTSLDLFGNLGAAFLMLLAGLEARLKDFESATWPILRIAWWNSLIPFLCGMGIARWFDYSWTESSFLGILFMASSVILVYSSVETLGLGKERVGQLLKGIVVIEDLASLLGLSLLVQWVDQGRFPLPIYFGLLISSVIILRMFLPEVVTFFFNRYEKMEDKFERQTRLIIGLLLLVVVLYSALKVHPIVAAFLVGFSLSSLKDVEKLREKVYTIGYALFVPVFFFVIGMRMDFEVLFKVERAPFFMAVLILGAFLSKGISGYLASRWEKLSHRESLFVGVASTSRITTTLSIAYTGYLLEMIDNRLLTAIILLILLSTLISPNLALFILKRKDSSA